MFKLILVGNSSPIYKVLHHLGDLENLKVSAIFTDDKKNTSIVKFAIEQGIDVFKIRELMGKSGYKKISDIKPNWLFNINSTFLFTKDILNIPTQGCLNMHPGKLPEYAGMHVNQWAIRNNEKVFGATLHWMVPKIDAGPICFKEEFPIDPFDTGLSLFMKAMNVGTKLVIKALTQISQGIELPKLDQDLSKRNIYFIKDALNGSIDWKMPAVKIFNFIRASIYDPFNSPTYQPTTIINGNIVLIKEANIVERISLEPNKNLPGQIVSINRNGLVISVANNELLGITVVKSSNKTFRGNEISSGLNLNIGDRFQ